MVITYLTIYFFYVAQGIIVPLVYGGVFAMLLYPICKFFENNGFPRIVAIMLTLVIVFVFFIVLGYILSAQIINFVKDLPGIAGELEGYIIKIEYFIFKEFGIKLNIKSDLLQNNISKFVDSGVVLLQGTISTFSVLFNFVGLVPVYIFLFLLYRTSLREFFLLLTKREKHGVVRKVFKQMQKVVQSYVSGLLIVMSIVAVLNTTALLIIGVEYAFFFGLLAALLMIIPYIGVFIGSTLPALFAWLVQGNFVDGLLVVAAFSTVQFIEGNIITPRLTGGKIRLNPLSAIVGLVAGGYLWGTAGLIISLPLIAIIKVIFDNITILKPYGFLLGTELSDGKHESKNSLIVPLIIAERKKSRRKK
jgi:predicted PurR-regulated permease PerM